MQSSTRPYGAQKKALVRSSSKFTESVRTPVGAAGKTFLTLQALKDPVMRRQLTLLSKPMRKVMSVWHFTAQMQIISPESNGQANILERVTTHLTATT